ncbi:hypothetical protein DPMN_030135 [Dreissena polymorpha]|uniref:Uncharacterized protein n=1 Tax=Dreissena polymorpha TaxID=45954 RepID=A0A9D4M226_DREPO|nr:hypothetical protein DPMN_030135 [Dreissena polymorpha]
MIDSDTIGNIEEEIEQVSETVTIESSAETSIPSGRRIVELAYIVEQLNKCCKCDSELNLTNTIREDRYGFGSALSVMCQNCGAINKQGLFVKHACPPYGLSVVVAAIV